MLLCTVVVISLCAFSGDRARPEFPPSSSVETLFLDSLLPQHGPLALSGEPEEGGDIRRRIN